MRFGLIIFLLFLEWTSSIAQINSVNGKVVDSQTNYPLAFVNITANEQKAGTATDIDGKFLLQSPEPIEQLTFSYVGYEKLKINPENKKNLLVKLEKTNYELPELVVLPGENPAHRIIKKVTENRDINNPEKLNSFSYTSYNKAVFTADYDSVYLYDKSKRETLDSSDREALEFLDDHYLMMMEFVSERKFLAPDKNNETVIASRISGLKNPMFTMLATQMQSFSFYDDYISLFDYNYLNPIAKGSINKYVFSLEDTVWAGNDTVFIIAFRPKKGANFDGLEGLLYINTKGYALQNVIAGPFEATDNDTKIKIQQKYEQIEDKWFPVQLNSDMTFGSLQVNNQHVVGIGRTYLKDISINPELEKKEFSNIEMTVAKDAYKKSDEFWNQFRQDSLNQKEQNTYHTIDSIGEAEDFDLKLKMLTTLLNGEIPWKFFNFYLDKFIDYNEYEGFRLGVGGHTNEQISRIVALGGCFAYGFRDNAFKYGGELSFIIDKLRKIQLDLKYSNDVIESGGVAFPFDFNPLSTEYYRRYLIQKMDKIEKYEALLRFHAMQYMDARVFANKQFRQTTDDYYFSEDLSNDISFRKKNYNLTEIGIGFRYAYNEKFMEIQDMRFPLGTDYPIIHGKITQGVPNLLDGEYSYTRFDLKVEKTFRIKNLGKPHVQLLGGYVSGETPYTLLYSGNGSFLSYNVSAENTFETMRLNEFLSDKYVSLFLSHNFGHLLLKAKKFKPDIVLVTNLGIGALTNPEKHQGIDINTLERGYFESGFRINNMLRYSLLGFGVGVFYRYGPYALPNWQDNLAAKFTLTVVM